MDDHHIHAGPGINERFARAIEREEAKAALKEKERAEKKQMGLSSAVVDGM